MRKVPGAFGAIEEIIQDVEHDLRERVVGTHAYTLRVRAKRETRAYGATELDLKIELAKVDQERYKVEYVHAQIKLLQMQRA